MEIEGDQQLRSVHCEMNVLTKSDGSALFTQGDTAIVVAVYGPINVKPPKLLVDRADVEAVYRSKSGLPCIGDRMLESLFRNTCASAIVLTSYPRTAVSVTVQEMQDSGGLLACAMNATCMALINSGISMKYLFAAVHCMIDQQNVIILDPSSSQLKESKASLTFVFDNVDKNVITVHTSGCFSPGIFNECLGLCQLASEKIFTFYRSVVTKYALNRM